jgi:hypothetical protein
MSSCLLLLFDFKRSWDVSTSFGKTPQYHTWWKSVLKLLHADGQTDMANLGLIGACFKLFVTNESTVSCNSRPYSLITWKLAETLFTKSYDIKWLKNSNLKSNLYKLDRWFKLLTKKIRKGEPNCVYPVSWLKGLKTFEVDTHTQRSILQSHHISRICFNLFVDYCLIPVMCNRCAAEDI